MYDIGFNNKIDVENLKFWYSIVKLRSIKVGILSTWEKFQVVKIKFDVETNIMHNLF